MRTDIKAVKKFRVKPQIERGRARRRAYIVAVLDEHYRRQPEAIDVCCRRLLADILRGMQS